MLRFPFASLRTRLTLLVILGILPALGLTSFASLVSEADRTLVFSLIEIGMVATIAVLTQTETGENPIEFKVENLPIAIGDPTLLQQVFNNLIDNAVKFSRARHPVVIEISSLPDGVIFVKDNGVGFPIEYAEQVFGA